MRVLKELNSGQYERTMVSQSEKGELLRLSSSKTNFKKDTLLIFNYLFMIFINRHFRKAHLDPWKWKNHQRRPYHQVRAASLSPLNFSASLSGEPTMWYIYDFSSGSITRPWLLLMETFWSEIYLLRCVPHDFYKSFVSTETINVINLYIFI